MFVNAIHNLKYADGVVMFDLVMLDPKDRSKVMQRSALEIPFEQFLKVHGLMEKSFPKMCEAHEAWLKGQLDAAPWTPKKAVAAQAAKAKPKSEAAPPKQVAEQGQNRPKAGRLIRKI